MLAQRAERWGRRSAIVWSANRMEQRSQRDAPYLAFRCVNKSRCSSGNSLRSLTCLIMVYYGQFLVEESPKVELELPVRGGSSRAGVRFSEK